MKKRGPRGKRLVKTDGKDEIMQTGKKSKKHVCFQEELNI